MIYSVHTVASNSNALNTARHGVIVDVKETMSVLSGKNQTA